MFEFRIGTTKKLLITHIRHVSQRTVAFMVQKRLGAVGSSDTV